MKLLAALDHRPLVRPPVWVMRQAGRYLPEYRELRSRHGFQQAVHDPALAAEITLQPIRRFRFDAAVIFSDIMTPLEGMGVQVDFAPGPELRPMAIEEVAALPGLDLDRVGFVFEALRKVRAELPPEVALIGFAGAPVTLLAYLLEGGGSKQFLSLRRALLGSPETTAEALQSLGRSMAAYLTAQVEAGADAVQLFDSWVGILPRLLIERFVVPAAATALQGVDVPSIYFAPGASHALESLPAVGADGYGVDWRLPLDEAWERIGLEHAIQGNLDPAVLLTDPKQITAAVAEVLRQAAGRPGHIFNLGHGIDKE
ncbi:MAG: uroporphyrinogen decarboxylase, partial [Acidimicrobiia bacterium]